MITWGEATHTYIDIKFDFTPKVTSLTNNKFSLATDAATPVVVDDPFKTIDVTNDYSTTGKMLRLRLKAALASGNYVLTASNIVAVSGSIPAADTFEFTVVAVPDPDPGEEDPFDPSPGPGPVVEDHSIKADVFEGISDDIPLNLEFYVKTLDPENGAVFVEDDQVVVITMSSPVDATTVDANLKVHRKLLGTGLQRWERLTPTATVTSNNITLTFDTGTFVPAYKYRVKLGADIAAADATMGKLGEEFIYTFATEIEPIYVDPEDFLVFYPDSTRLEVLEYIHKYSLEVQTILDGETPTFDALEYIRAAVLCSLRKVYDAHAAGQELQLGDLRIQDSSSSSDNNDGTNPCELAMQLRRRLVRVGMKSVVRGDAWPNPMPSRVFKFHKRAVLRNHGHTRI